MSIRLPFRVTKGITTSAEAPTVAIPMHRTDNERVFFMEFSSWSRTWPVCGQSLRQRYSFPASLVQLFLGKAAGKA
jgi:hypothetical protein